jgi:hypothetical protein
MDILPEIAQYILKMLDMVSYKRYYMTTSVFWNSYIQRCDIIMSRALTCIQRREATYPRIHVADRITIYGWPTMSDHVHTRIYNPKYLDTYTTDPISLFNTTKQTKPITLYSICAYIPAIYTQSQMIFKDNIDPTTCVYRLLKEYLADHELIRLYLKYILQCYGSGLQSEELFLIIKKLCMRQISC